MFHPIFSCSRADRKIIEQAARVLAEGHGRTMQEIADISGIGRTTLYRHFRTREDLLRAIKAVALEEARAAVIASHPEEGNAEDALRRVISGLVTVGDRYRIMVGEGMHGEEGRAEKKFLAELLHALVQRGQREGVFAPGLSSSWILSAMAHLLSAAIRQVGDGDLAKNQAATLVADTLLRGVQVPPTTVT